MVVKANCIALIDSVQNYLNGYAKLSIETVRNVLKEEDVQNFITKLDETKGILEDDLNFFLECDPACNSKEEIISAYPGFKAILTYRTSNILFNLGYRVEARIISENAHTLTGIDIHPGATISHPFFIDHGTGIVIGETAIVGKYVRIYQGVTLGALSLGKGKLLKGTKRHPTILDNVIIYSNASILGDITIGNNVTIGSNVFLLESIPDNMKVVIQKPDLIIKNK